MTRLFIHVEGQTEESFVNNVLYHHLTARGYTNVSARLMGNARQRSNRGGVKPWTPVKAEIARHLSEDSEVVATIMVDYYAMPLDWPGRGQAAQDPRVTARAGIVQAQMAKEISAQMGSGFNTKRFVPFVLMHEFEALLFSDCDAFANGIGHPSAAGKFHHVVTECGSPELINDSPHTAPSKRIERIVPEYKKILHGTIAALDIGIDRMIEKCPNFRDWLQRLVSSAQ